MVGPDVCRRFDAALFRQPLDDGRIQLQVGRATASPAVPEREGAAIRKTTIPAMIVFRYTVSSPAFLPAVRPAGLSSSPFPPS